MSFEPIASDVFPLGTDKRIFQALDVWRAARKGKLVPRKRDIDPIAMPGLLRYAYIFFAEPHSDQITCLLAGEDINDAWGGPIKGKTLEDIYGDEDYVVLKQRWRMMLDEPLILYGKKTEHYRRRFAWSAERLIMPLTSSGDEPDHAFGITLYELSTGHNVRPILHEDDYVAIPCDQV